MPPANPTARVVIVDDVAPPDITIVSWPMRDQPFASAIVFAIAVGASIGAGFIAGSVVVGLLSAAALLVALRHWWLAAEFHLNELGVKRTLWGRSRRTPWREIAGYQLRREGVALLVDGDTSPIAMLRCMYIPYLARRETIVALVEYNLRGEHVVRQASPDS
jgi:hypothetical protein